MFQELPEGQRADAVNSMVYEANARLRDPIYGCAGAICHLQKQIGELQAELARAQAEILNMQCQNANLLDQFSKNQDDMNVQENMQQTTLTYDHDHIISTFLSDEGVSWEPLWTWSKELPNNRSLKELGIYYQYISNQKYLIFCNSYRRHWTRSQY